MKFKRYGRLESLPMSDRMKAAYLRKLERQRSAYPLFPDHIAESQISLDAQEEKRLRQSLEFDQSRRAFNARVWRESRALYFRLPQEIKSRIMEKWNVWTGPLTPTYFAWMVDVESGEQAKRVQQGNIERALILERVRASLGYQEPLFS